MARIVVQVVCFAATLLTLVLGSPGASAQQGTGKQDPVNISTRKAMEAFGQRLFFARHILSLQGTTSCADCHNPDPRLGFSDGRKVAVGVIGSGLAPTGFLGVRNTRTLIGAKGLADKLVNSDGRVARTRNQCFQAVTDPLVMGLPSIAAMVGRLNGDQQFVNLANLAGTYPITEDFARDAMVAFLATLESKDCLADRLAAGLKVSAPPSVLRGWIVFNNNCTECHQPQNDWRDYKFHNIGTAVRANSRDRGRGAITNNPADNYCFATPTLREVGKTQPYMHDGSMADLKEVIGFKASGGRFKLNGVTYTPTDANFHPSIAAIDISQKDATDLYDFVVVGFQSPNYPVVENPFATRTVSK